ncbi:MAG: DUF4215 domain-containing protein, partial [Myxococcales bacterium]
MGIRLTAAAGAPGAIGFSGDLKADPTNSAQPSISGCASNGAGPHAIYAITPAVDGNLSLDLLGNYEGALMHVHRACQADSLYDCRGAASALTPVRASVPVRAEETLYVFVDSHPAASGGLYTLQAKLEVAGCGNEALDGVEQCDDGNMVGGDGCSATCTIERNAASYACPGQGVALTAAAPSARVWGTTIPENGLPRNRLGTCGALTQTAPDVVYAVTSETDGYLVATARADFNAAVAMRALCEKTDGGAADDLACGRAATGNAPKTAGVPIAAGSTVYVAVDGYLGDSRGNFSLDLAVEPTVCGNGRIEGGENCDDGNLETQDGCSDTCRLEPEPTWNRCETSPELPWETIDGQQTVRVRSGNTNLTNTMNGANVHTLSCHSVGAEAWYRVVAPGTGTITARVAAATFNSSIGIRNGCLPN